MWKPKHYNNKCINAYVSSPLRERVGSKSRAAAYCTSGARGRGGNAATTALPVRAHVRDAARRQGLRRGALVKTTSTRESRGDKCPACDKLPACDQRPALTRGHTDWSQSASCTCWATVFHAPWVLSSNGSTLATRTAAQCIA